MFRLTQNEGIARLTIDRPEARNAIPVSGWQALADRADEAGDAGARLLVIAGAGGAFCAGADLNDFAVLQTEPQARTAFREAMQAGLERLRSLPLPTVALIEGACYGAGVALAMACDMRIAAPEARFAITPAKMGISYPQEDIYALVSLVGPGQASRLLFTGLPIDAAEAERIGLVDMTGTPEELLAMVAQAVAANDAQSLAVLKRGIRLAAQGSVRDEGQDRSFDDLFGSDGLARRLAERAQR